jgi:hypothetical protein
MKFILSVLINSFFLKYLHGITLLGFGAMRYLIYYDYYKGEGSLENKLFQQFLQ